MVRVVGNFEEVELVNEIVVVLIIVGNLVDELVGIVVDVELIFLVVDVEIVVEIVVVVEIVD